MYTADTPPQKPEYYQTLEDRVFSGCLLGLHVIPERLGNSGLESSIEGSFDFVDFVLTGDFAVLFFR
ncbi:MAG: hypothetical protein ACXWNK_14580 [Vulcanimicrobiaceae bacterium]